MQTYEQLIQRTTAFTLFRLRGIVSNLNPIQNGLKISTLLYCNNTKVENLRKAISYNITHSLHYLTLALTKARELNRLYTELNKQKKEDTKNGRTR